MSKFVSSENIDIQYHTGIFNEKTHLATAAVGIVAISALAFSALALLQGAGPLGSLSSSWAYGVGGAGAGLVLADVIALLVLSKKHGKVKAVMKESLESQTSDFDGWKEQLGDLKGSSYREVPLINQNPAQPNPHRLVVQTRAGKQSAHLFANSALAEAYTKDLKKEGFILMAGELRA
ncbi:hypothetical protein ACFLR2_00380 [Chlamydiota bacterium]